jgi:glutamate synthase (NADPH/NADH) large chain
MSGGIAYLLDVRGGRVNSEMVDLDPLDESDVDLVADLLRRHAAHTGSPVAAVLLADWGDTVRRFTKVMPRDYKRVLAESVSVSLELEAVRG